MKRSAWVLGIVVPILGCGGRVVVDDTTVGGKGDSCAASCEAQHPESLGAGYLLKTVCGCRTCSDACKQSACGNKETPSAACLPCLQEGLKGECSHNNGYFEAGCIGDKDCNALVECILACPP